MKQIIHFWIFLCLFGTWACHTDPKSDIVVNVHSDEVINENYLGNGAQWDPYQLDYGSVKLQISDEDWQKLYDRLDFMRPQFLRVMTNTSSVVKDGGFNPDSTSDQLLKILSYCQSRGVTVMFGDWGWSVINNKEEINCKYLAFAVRHVNYLINEKGFSCIKYYNLINEPNGYWSSVGGNYSLWAKALRFFHDEVKKIGLSDQISMVGPDVAIWTENEVWWVDSCAAKMPDRFDLYDIHTYPSKTTVNSGEYGKIIRAYRENVPKGKKIVMGEIGFKFVEKADSLYRQENKRRIKAHKHASEDDSQMFVYDYMYGTDMADALFQTVNNAYSGAVIWMLDDAMYSKGGQDKLKIWGFWNILGEEYFGAKEEAVRPWYYAWSLLSKYMPTGAKILKVDVSEEYGVKAIAVEKDGHYMLAMVNVAKQSRQVKLQSTSLPKLQHIKQFIYADGQLITQGDHTILPNKKDISLNLKEGLQVDMPAESLLVYTNFDY